MAERATISDLLSDGGESTRGELLLACSKAHATHEGLTILDDFDLEIRTGERIALVADSEWAARLIPRCLIGLTPYEEGEIRLFGQRLADISEQERLAIRRKVGYLFHNSGLIHNLTIWYNVALPALYHSQFGDLEGVKERVDVILERCLLTGVKNAHPDALDEYSRKRAALARSWVLSPPFVILEDPLVEIDSRSGSRLMEMALGSTPHAWEDRDPRPASPAVLITSQNLHESFFRFVDRLIVLEEGKVVVSDDPKRFDRRGMMGVSDLIDTAGPAQT
jgi:ABC-type transporter Mla maintaining outer membrane lipid asymmetry ATPase subunit MlaF